MQLKGIVNDRRAQTLAMLFILAFLVRYHFEAAGLFHTDSIIDARAAEDTLANGRLYYLQGNLGYPGESILMTAVYAVFKLFGAQNAESAVLFAGVLFGALCVPMVYLLVCKLFDSEYAGVYSALIMAFLPVQLSLSTFGKGHGMELFFLLLSAYAVVHAGERKDVSLKVLASCLLGFTMAIRQTSVLLFPAFLLLYWRGNPPVAFKTVKSQVKLLIKQTPKQAATDLAVLVIPAFAVFWLAFVPKMLEDPSYSVIGSIQSVGAETNAGFSLFSPVLKQSVIWATASVTPLGWALFALGLIIMWQKDRRAALALAAWFLFFFLYLGNIISTSPRFVIPALAVPVMLSAAALDWIGSKWGHIAAAIVLAVLVGWMMSNVYPVLEYRSKHCGPCEFSKKIGELTEPNAVIIAMDESQHYEYYAKRATMGHPSGSSLADPAKIKDSLDTIESLLRNGTPVYATTQGLSYDGLPENVLAYDPDTMTLGNTKTGKAYTNLRFDKDKRTLTDIQTQAVHPLAGIYSLELFNRFAVYPEMRMENEDWHHSDIEGYTYNATLYKIFLRGNFTAG
jgi:hypothetical protein